jgi:hypothetical protein
MSRTSVQRPSEDASLRDLLSSVDESPEFYDPYSDLNLFLSQKIKKEMQHTGCLKKWSLKIQEELIQKITPEFQVKFPQYRLGVAALKKIWEKISYYSQQIDLQQEAIAPDGKLNIAVLIKENLKQYFNHKVPSPLQPFHYAHQLAMKMSECIATVDGIRPKLDHLTKLVWAIQRHLIKEGTPEKHKSPYDEYDKIDCLIVKTILEISAKEPQLSQDELERKTKETLHILHDLPSFSSLDAITAKVSSLLAEKHYQTSPFHTLFLTGQKRALFNLIQRHSVIPGSSVQASQLPHLVRRIISLYHLVSQLPDNLTQTDIEQAVCSCHPTLQNQRPDFPQTIYAFISAELLLLENQPIESIVQHIWTAYQEAIYLPSLKGNETHILEVVIWKTLSEKEGLLFELPDQIEKRIEEEIVNLMIDSPAQSFSTTVQMCVDFFKKAKELILLKKWSEIERKIHIWAVQGDMLCRWIQLDSASPLINMITKKFKGLKGKHLNHQAFVGEIAQYYLKEHPDLMVFAGQLTLRIWTFYKYAWYTLFAQEGESSYDRFIQWHINFLLSLPFNMTSDLLFKHLEEISKKAIPLAPFYPDRIKALIAALEKKPSSQQKEGNAQDLPHAQ